MGKRQQLPRVRQPGEGQIHLFAPNGIPIRATCTVNLGGDRRHPRPQKQNPTSGALTADQRAHHGDRRHACPIAYREYGDSELWRPLAAYNGIDDPMRISDGTRVLLPGVEVLRPERVSRMPAHANFLVEIDGKPLPADVEPARRRPTSTTACACPTRSCCGSATPDADRGRASRG